MTLFNFSDAALDAIAETRCDPAEDLQALIEGTHSPSSLWGHCIDGADEDRIEGWRDYFSEVIAAYEEGLTPEGA